MSTGTDPPHNRDSDDGPARFRALLENAIDCFRKETGLDLLAQPYGDKLLQCDSVNDLVSVLKKQNEAFETFRAHGETIRAVLAPVVRLVRIFLETGSEVAAASNGAVPGGKAIFVAFGVLLDATRGVSEVYGALGDLFRRLGTFLGRLDIYLQSPLEPNAALKDIFTSIFFKLFTVLRIVTKYLKLENHDKKSSAIRRSLRPIFRRTKDFGRVLLGNTEVKGALAELDDLTKEESLATAATTLVVAHKTHAAVQDARRDVGTVRDYQGEHSRLTALS
ncbi:hypothetical protein K488DRAFT_91681 [Vararia minispora EC-137]|uniref:Uncharacterized protein n=1 Tax=Vararia minispora EC-137 TaxID=1314806 RepID=A0ACB8Q5G7_9AGAM|nr:hypothetical protein K488DRAFT_91681 [Vararia minispora EC-137]